MNDLTKTLLLDYHAGRATSLQRKQIEEWLKDEANLSLYYETLMEWEMTHPQYVADLNAGVDRFLHRLDNEPAAPQTPVADPRKRTDFRRFSSAWLVAAMVLLVTGVGGWLFRDAIRYRTYATGNGEIQHIRLPDGSRVTLNANSSLILPRFGFARLARRDVKLIGEAEFSVVHTVNNQRFVVQTPKQLDIEVLGTEFVVLARERATRVVLTKGKVKLRFHRSNQPDRMLTMRPGQQVKLNPVRNELTLMPASRPEQFSAWKNRQYVFDDTPLSEIGRMIQDDYGLKVEIRESRLAQRQVSGTFNADNADELLQVLRDLLSINVSRQRNRVILYE